MAPSPDDTAGHRVATPPQVPVLCTERLVLRGWTADDADPLERICSDPETMRYIGDGTPMPAGRGWHGVAYLAGHWALTGTGQWALEDATSGALVGRAGLYQPAGWPGLELGWLIDRTRWGQGLATEAARAARDWAFTALDAPTLISLIQFGNDASIRVAEKLGAHPVEPVDLDGREVACYRLERG